MCYNLQIKNLTDSLLDREKNALGLFSYYVSVGYSSDDSYNACVRNIGQEGAKLGRKLFDNKIVSGLRKTGNKSKADVIALDLLKIL